MSGIGTRTALAVGCVVLISIGQLLFRQAGLAIEQAGTWTDQRAAILLAVALAAYGIATIAWVHVLRTVPLGLAYPIMGLSFVLVPALGALFLREHPSMQQLAGAVLILAGITLAHAGP